MKTEDWLLWRRVVRLIKPLPGRTLPSFPSVDEDKGDEEQKSPAKPPLAYQSPPPPQKPLQPEIRLADMGHIKQVRRGRIAYEQTLDLHGLGQDEARFVLLERLEKARKAGVRCVLVITGTGAGRPHASSHASHTVRAPGVLRRRLADWLHDESIRPWITGYAPAHRRHGGQGAFYVFLRKSIKGKML